MDDNFDLYEYKDQLKSKLREQSLTGRDASTKVIAFLRDSIYPKLDGAGMDEFIIDMCEHMDVEPPAYRLDEEYTTSIDKQTIKIKDLSFDLLGKKPMFGFDAQNNDDSSSKLHNQDDLDRWKDGVMSKYGNVDVKIDLDASDEIQVMDKQFQDDKNRYIDGKAAALKDWGTNV